jgi:hypothetical protein
MSMGFRASVTELLETLASRELQEQYRNDVPIADVAAELVCGWFDDLYHPTAPEFAVCFNEAQLAALSTFHRTYQSEKGSLPKEGGIEAYWGSPAWERIGAAAERARNALEGDT